ncbi:MAG: hypothetical protein RMJ33_14660 [Saprospiraceae bacterium]|nr:hypothetical protein [Saprospiraceae bacterium]MDW8231071.1 hypothetical protein [Saprospiraceae bacterium]
MKIEWDLRVFESNELLSCGMFTGGSYQVYDTAMMRASDLKAALDFVGPFGDIQIRLKVVKWVDVRSGERRAYVNWSRF